MTEKCRFAKTGLQLLCLTIVISALLNSTIRAQNVRLRANVNPNPISASTLRYADITADGNLAVMAGYRTRGAYVFDVSNPDAPFLTARYNPGDNLQILEAVIVGKRAYFGVGGTFTSATGTGINGAGDGVHIVDLTDAANPVLLGKVNAATANGFNVVHEIVVDGDYLYENLNSFADKRIKVFNVANPAQPRFVRDIVPNDISWVHAVHIRNGKLFTSGWGNSSNPGLTEVYDISNIESEARFLGQVASGNNTHSSWTSEDGNYLYVCRELYDGDLRVYDIRNLAHPLLVKVIKAEDLGINAICPHNPIVKGNRLYVAWYQAGVQVFDISNPANPRRTGQYDTYAQQFAPTEARAEAANLKAEPWDMICGATMLANTLPSSYAGSWTAFPLLGDDRVLVTDLTGGLFVFDASKTRIPDTTVAQKFNNNADFDGDGKTDYASYRPPSGVWTIENSSNQQTRAVQFGASNDVLTPGDFDGDNKTDVAVWRPQSGTWFIQNSSNNEFRAVQFGQTGDVPVVADYDADGKADPAVFRPSNGTWYVSRSTLGFAAAQWGTAGDEPVRGDFDGDGKADYAVVRNVNNQKVWFIMPSSSSIFQVAYFGLGSDKTVVADFDGDDKTDIAVYRPEDTIWYVQNSRTNTVTSQQFGIASDVPIAADFDGDGKADIAHYRKSNNAWYHLASSNSAFFGRQFGAENDLPAACAAQSINGCALP